MKEWEIQEEGNRESLGMSEVCRYSHKKADGSLKSIAVTAYTGEPMLVLRWPHTQGNFVSMARKDSPLSLVGLSEEWRPDFSLYSIELRFVTQDKYDQYCKWLELPDNTKELLRVDIKKYNDKFNEVKALAEVARLVSCELEEVQVESKRSRNEGLS